MLLKLFKNGSLSQKIIFICVVLVVGLSIRYYKDITSLIFPVHASTNGKIGSIPECGSQNPCVLGVNTATSPYQNINSDVYVSGKIGIGVSTPANPLDIVGNISTTGNIGLGGKPPDLGIGNAAGSISLGSEGEVWWPGFNGNNPSYVQVSTLFGTNTSALEYISNSEHVFYTNYSNPLFFMKQDAKSSPIFSMSGLIKLSDGKMHEVDFTNCEGSSSDEWLRFMSSGNTGYSGSLCGNDYYVSLAVGKFFAANAVRYSDVAEVMDVNPQADVESGDILTADSLVNSSKNILQQSDKKYDSAVIGVVSSPETASFILGIAGVGPENAWKMQDKKPVALAGKVIVKVSNTNGPIKKGDPITSSEILGVGMKATDPGTIIGTALEDFDPSTQGGSVIQCPSDVTTGVTCGKILIFEKISWLGDQQTFDKLQNEIDQLKQEVKALQR